MRYGKCDGVRACNPWINSNRLFGKLNIVVVVFVVFFIQAMVHPFILVAVVFPFQCTSTMFRIFFLIAEVRLAEDLSLFVRFRGTVGGNHKTMETNKKARNFRYTHIDLF